MEGTGGRFDGQQLKRRRYGQNEAGRWSNFLVDATGKGVPGSEWSSFTRSLVDVGPLVPYHPYLHLSGRGTVSAGGAAESTGHSRTNLTALADDTAASMMHSRSCKYFLLGTYCQPFCCSDKIRPQLIFLSAVDFLENLEDVLLCRRHGHILKMKTDFKFSNLLGTVYSRGNLLFNPDGTHLYSPVGNRVTVFDLVKYATCGLFSSGIAMTLLTTTAAINHTPFPSRTEKT